MRFLVFADLHLDATFAWAGRDGARRRRQAIRDTLSRILELARELRPDAVLCAGDLYEHDRSRGDTGAFLRSRFEDLALPVYIAPGNHDYLGEHSLYERVDWPRNVTLFREDRMCAVEIAEGLRLWGAAHRAPAGTEGFLEPDFTTGGGAIDLALFHGSEGSGLPFEGEAKSPYAPFDAESIERSGLRHAFVGHFHTPAEGRWHTYPGNPQPLAFGESGTRGVVEVTVRDDGEIERRWHVVQASPAHDLELDLEGVETSDDIRDRVLETLSGLQGVARLRLVGEVPSEVEIDTARLREVAHGLDAEPEIDVRAVRVAYDFDTLAEEQSVRGQFVRDVRASDRFEDERERRSVLVTGLRALQGRDDLEVPA